MIEPVNGVPVHHSEIALVFEHPVGGADRPIDMTDCAIAQAVGKRIVLFPGDVGAGLSQELQRLMNTPAVIRMIIQRRMIIDVFAVIESRLLDVVDGRVDLTYGFSFVGRLSPISGTMLDHPTRSPQIGQ